MNQKTTVALHTRLKPGCEDTYERIHARLRDEVAQALVDGGVHEWTIWRDGRDLFHLVEVDDWHALLDFLRDNPADQAWQAEVGQLLELNLAPGSDGMPEVWHLTSQITPRQGQG